MSDFAVVKLRRQVSAGRRADEIYRGLAAWRRRVLWVAVPFTLPWIAGGTALGIYTSGVWRFVGGILFGVGFSMFLWMRDTPPQYVENWADGAAGERKTERALRGLAKEGWAVRHDLPGRRGTNIDHVVIGPPGIFLLDSKVRAGRLELHGDRLVSRRLGVEALTYERALGGAVAAAAQDLWLDLGGVRRGVPRVRGVAVVWGRLDESKEADRFAILPGRQLAEWLSGRPQMLNADQVRDLATRVDGLAASREQAAA